jgi:hypothetical protein
VILHSGMATRSVTRTREMMPLELRASVVPKSVDVDKRTVQITWTTGARVLRGGFFSDPYLEELSLEPKHVRMQRLKSGTAPALNAHSSYSLGDVLGVIESAELEPKRGSATVRFDTGPEAEDVFRKVANGIVRNWSVGYRVHKMVKVEDGEGKTPVYRAIDWEPYEISPVPIGADPGCVTRSAAATANPCEFVEERTMDDDETPAGTKPAAPAPAPAGAPIPSADQVRAIERDRVRGIQRVGQALKRPAAEIEAAINGDTTLDVFRASAQDAFAATETIAFERRDPRIEPGEDSRDKWMRGASAWLVQRAAVGGIVAEHAKRNGDKIDLDPGEFRGLRLIDLARQSLERAGVRTAGMLPMELVGQALTQRSATPAASTGDFPILLENVLYKVLLAQYGVTPDTWPKFCKTGSVSDFRASKRYRLGSFGTLSALNELGEFANKSIPDGERQSLIAGTKGNIISISRQAIINDDMGAFSSLATALGRAAKLTVEVDVYALLALNGGLGPLMSDGLALFNAAHNNITPGAALGSGAIDLDRVAMASQKDQSNNEILALTPAVLVLPIGLGGVARQINTGQYDFDSTKFQAPNRVGGLFRDIVDTARITGTRRYLFADPGMAPTIEVAFLDGQQQPFMDIQQGWRVDGVEWKVRLDYGVAAIDHRGAVTNAGA